MSPPDALPDLGGGVAALPRDEEGPVFRAPWEAQAFAMAVTLHEAGVFTWPEWAEALGATIKAAQAAGDADRGDTYYEHWLATLEGLVKSKGLTTAGDFELRVERAVEAASHHDHVPRREPVARA